MLAVTLPIAGGAFSVKGHMAFLILPAHLAEHNPIDRLEPLARTWVPIYHLHGDSDSVVPLEKNSGLLAQRYRQLGGVMTLNEIKGQGHNMWPGGFECQELVDFAIPNSISPGPGWSGRLRRRLR